MPLPRDLAAVIAFALPAAALAQQPVWQRIPNPDDAPPSQAQTAYDSWRQRSVAVDATWLAEFDRASWRRGSPGSGTGLQNSTVAFDRARGVTVAFGGNFPFVADAGTREWNGTTWTLRTLPTSPPGRSRAAMAFDRLRARLVLFGGQNALSQKFADTWEYDGTTWTQVPTTVGPLARTLHTMAWDPQRGVVVLFGGLTTAWTNETWEWNGTAWSPHPSGPTVAPQVLAYDEARGRCVLLGLLPGTFTTSTAERLGTTWTTIQSPTTPTPIAAPQGGGCYDDVLGAVLANGIDFDNQSRTWSWNGSDWIARNEPYGPLVTAGAALAPCPLRQSLVRFGVGVSPQQNRTTWEFVGGRWRTVPTTTLPPSFLAWPSLATEPAGTVLLFGGSDSVASNASWRFTGTDWQLLTPTTAPSARSEFGMTAVPSGVLLFGGRNATGAPLGDTWLWNGTNWSQLTPPQSPSARANAAMAYDPNAGDVLLFGGGIYQGPTLGDRPTPESPRRAPEVRRRRFFL